MMFVPCAVSYVFVSTIDIYKRYPGTYVKALSPLCHGICLMFISYNAFVLSSTSPGNNIFVIINSIAIVLYIRQNIQEHSSANTTVLWNSESIAVHPIEIKISNTKNLPMNVITVLVIRGEDSHGWRRLWVVSLLQAIYSYTNWG